MKLIHLVSLYFFVNTQFLFAQTLLSKDIKFILNSKQTDSEKLYKIKNLLKEHKSTITPELGIGYNEIGLLQYKNQLKNEAIFSFKKSIQILKAYKNTHLNALNRARNNLAWLYKYNDLIEEEYGILNEIINDKGNDQYTFDAQINVALLDSERGDYYLGIKKINLLLADKKTLENELVARIKIIQIYAMLAEIDSKKNIFENISIIKEHQNFIKKNFSGSQLEEKELYEFYNNIANIYESIGDYNSAIQFYTKSKNYFKKQNNEYEYFFVLNNLGYLYGKQDKIALASAYFKEIINDAEDVNQTATAYDNLAYFSKVKSIEKTTYFRKAIQTILELEQSQFELPKLETIIDSGYQQEVMVYLVDLASNYLDCFKSTKNKSFLFQAKETLYLVDKLVSIIRYESTTEQSKLFWIEKGVNTYLLGAEVCYLLNKPTEGFYFIEKNKALLLQENIKTYQAKLEFQVPEDLRAKEFKLHYEVLLAEKKFQEFPNNMSFKTAYLKKQKEFENFMNSLVHKYPEYVRLKQKIDIVSLKSVIAALDKNECFVSYILNEKKGYGLFADQTSFHFFEIDNVVNFQQNIITLKKYYTQFSLDKKENLLFQQTSVNVFKSLFPFPNALSRLKDKKLTIIADGSLLNFPFEALCTNANTRIKDSYLINFSEISYLQSYSAFEKIKQWKNNASKKILATVPYQFSDKSLPTLTRSKEVIEYLDKYSSSAILFDKQATKEKFKDAIKEYEVLHLNTHAGIDSKTQTPWIAFSNTKMTLDELYGISNQAELVILDACKTNEGQILSGEGIFSLSRGFFMNGTKSVLSSLWNVNEKAGNEIITSFYAELQNGNTKSKALQLAKINYLQQHQLSEILPYHWASFILTGNNDAIEINQKWYYNSAIKLVLGLICGVIIIFIVMNKRRI